MFVVKFFDGLGNQLFQYNFTKYLSERFPEEEVSIDIQSYAHNKLHGGYLLKTKRYGKASHYDEKAYRRITDETYTQDISAGDNIIFEGYWQDTKYFPEKMIRFDEVFGNNISIQGTNKNYLSEIRLYENSVSVHIRRGDYLKSFLHSNIATKAYFKNAVAYIAQKIPNAHFFVFSDDIEWIKLDGMLDSYQVTYVKNNNTYGHAVIYDLFLMSQCKHNIISNSSFSWWAQQFNSNPDKIVITPEYWINEPCPGFSAIVASLQQMPHMMSVANIPLNAEKSQAPFFSIILSAYNQQDCIHRSLSSILNQTFQNFELIIIDDGSTDGTPNILAQYANLNEKVVIIKHTNNMSLHIVRMDGVAQAKGKYIIFLDGNDYFVEDAFGLLNRKILENPGYDFYEYEYIEHPANFTRIPCDTRSDRFAALFDDKNTCQHTIWNKVYTCELLKKAYSNMERIYLNANEDLYGSIVIAYYARKVIQINEVITNYSIGTGMTTSKQNFDSILIFMKECRKALDCVNNFVVKMGLQDRANILSVEAKIFIYTIGYINQHPSKEDQYKLFFLLPKYFSFQLVVNYFSKLEEKKLKLQKDAVNFRKGKWNPKYFFSYVFKVYIPKRIQNTLHH
ncbi:MAG: hypothetical protein Ta2A_17700 [Treponemataceae bacterium]|nr:MAG: hypothetical protein Ta2A_17700 [Treponemataceae bacterium]